MTRRVAAGERTQLPVESLELPEEELVRRGRAWLLAANRPADTYPRLREIGACRDLRRRSTRARLRPHLRVRQLAVLEAGIAATAAVDGNTTTPKSRIFKREPADLRGIPVVGPGVSGAQFGTRPEDALLAKEARRWR